MRKNVLGIDIGYSNLKLAWSNGDGIMQTVVRPSGAAPLSAMPMAMGASVASLDGGERVRLPNGEEWVGAVSHGTPQRTPRVLSKDYPETDAYLATFLAGLKIAGLKQIDSLVTGLPVSQFYSDGGRAAKRLTERLQGTHFVSGEPITVAKVAVIPQPVGSFFAYAVENPEDFTRSDLRCLTIDPGYYSVDWTLLVNAQVRNSASGTSTEATSRLLEDAAEQIRARGGKVNRERLEDMVRSGTTHVLANGQRIELAPFLEAAAMKVSKAVAFEVGAKVREDDTGFDVIVLTGGGAPFYQAGLQAAFRDTPVRVAKPPVAANAIGFYHFGGR